ncbi:hypothetical protein [Amycolatopsis keratiniphila]|uniref:Uncharacterized protein n=1 Tax=Amycolatopsis keratiniphila TaxID=129921 RepID=W6HVS9_9PSEU|nr:hypothetical protein [Amycolatopsis keratiniphila]AHJ58559.1 hypothetical protein AORI_P044 [Amycolatopsis keratiniphila]
MEEDQMAKNNKPLKGVGKIAEKDDIAPEGEVITEQHIRDYRASVEETHRRMGLPTDNLWSDD